MLPQQMDRDELQQELAQLDQALHNHQQWYNNLIRILTCRLSFDKHDILPKAHKECLFGQWYYSDASKNMSDQPGFIAIGEAHKHMHQLATNILINLDMKNAISSLDFDNFANSLERLRLEIYALKNELETLLYNRDPLTMTINRVNMLPFLREQLDLMKRQPHPCCLAMMDLDFFKRINDDYGHIVGDKVLASISHYLIEHLRSYDKIFRYGGEEFLFCLQQLDPQKAHEMVERLREDIAKMSINIEQNDPIFMTVSFGIAPLETHLTVEESIDNADKALYYAKSSGRNCTKIWDPSMNELHKKD